MIQWVEGPTEEQSYWEKIKPYFTATVVLFFGTVLVGYWFASVVDISLLETLRKAFSGLTGLNPLSLALFIFLNNAGKSFLAIILGILLGIAPILFVIANGIIVGVVVLEVSRIKGLEFAVAALLPHGIIEIPMVLLSAAIGIRIGRETIHKLRGEGNISREMNLGLKFFLKYVMPLLMVAALIEAFVTPHVIEFLLHA